jgi:GntR family transcriptional regulator
LLPAYEPSPLQATSDQPLYRHLVDWLRVDLTTKAPGDRIDSEPRLAKRFGVSRFTVTRAIEILVDEGLVNRRQGLGSFVAAAPLKRTANYLLSFTEAVLSQGRIASHRLLSFGPVRWREGLPYPEDLPLIGLDRLRLVDRIPTAIHRSIISEELARAVGLNAEIAGAPRFSLYRFFDDAGLTIASGAETLRARGPTEEEAELLKLGDDRVVMAVQRHTYAANGIILDAVDAVYDARRYSYRAELRRDPETAIASFHPQSAKVKEQGNATNSNTQHAFGPRLGPWGDHRSGG